MALAWPAQVARTHGKGTVEQPAPAGDLPQPGNEGVCADLAELLNPPDRDKILQESEGLCLGVGWGEMRRPSRAAGKDGARVGTWEHFGPFQSSSP